jgi:hypothetical protein
LAFANEPGGTGKLVQINNGSPGPVRSVPFWASGLSCPSATECWLVGQYHPGGFGMFIIHPDGSGLTYVRSGYASFIQGMVCTSMTNCYVFASKGGNPDPAGGGFFNFVARYNGHRFRAITRVVPYGGGALCLPASCIGVGTQGVGSMHRRLVGVVYRLPPL